MKRVFWLALGATVGVLVVRKLSQTAQRLTPQGVSRSLTVAIEGLGDAVRDFAAEVRVGMAEREADLRETLGLDGRHDAVDVHTAYPTDVPTERGS